ncbi:hypothetical protein NM688_g9372 [Phlebia brevispora]|uniref:Uncharacterized protein n=1 Tax=Phlebia brevispora TaxID=194682 RepID=A0ACC1RGG5_9APHY|nr:hypothetical protein NM688_g9372 [Phlebia brevispora]
MSKDESTPSDTELTEALHDVAKQLKDMTEQLLPAGTSIAEAVKKKENDEVDPEDKADAMDSEDELWETTRDTIKHDDQVQKSRLTAGRTSSTTFWHSYIFDLEDSGDGINTFLAHISLQISSFATAPSFVNSSAPAVPLHYVISASTSAHNREHQVVEEYNPSKTP